MSEHTYETTAGPHAEFSAELRLRDEQAMGIVKNHVLGAMGACLIPAPMLDMVAVGGIQMAMLNSLSQKYGIPFSQNIGKSVVASLMGGLGVGVLSRPIYLSLAKAMPGLGTFIGVATMPAVSGGLTYALGKVFIQHFSSGGTFLNFNPEKVREYFRGCYEQGKTMAADLAGGSRKAPSPGAH